MTTWVASRLLSRLPIRRVLAGAGIVLVAAAAVALAGFNPADALLGILAAVLAAGMFVAPALSISVLAIFLLLQQFLTNVVGGPETDVGRVIHQLDKYILVAGVVRVGLALAVSKRRDPLRRWTAWSAAYCGLGLLSGLVHGVPLGTLMLGAFLALKFPLLVLLGLAIPWTPEDADRAVRWVVRLGPVLLASGVILLVAPDAVRALFTDPGAAEEDFFRRGGLQSMQGIFTHPGNFGWAMSLVGCYGFANLLQRRKGPAALALATGAIGVLWSLRRKPLIALPIAMLSSVITLRTPRQRVAVLGTLVVLCAGTWLVGRQQLSVVSRATAAEYLDPDREDNLPRLLLYGVGWQVASSAFPLGAGFGRFGSYASVLDYSPLYDQYGLSSVYGFTPDDPRYITDSYWPSVMAETGLLGAAVHLALIVALWLALRRATRMPDSPGASRLLAQAAGLALVELLVESAAGPVFATSLAAFAVGVPIGISLRLAAPPATPAFPVAPAEPTRIAEQLRSQAPLR